MSDSQLRIVSDKPSDPAQPGDLQQDAIAELRRLLIEPEQVQINNILERLNSPRTRAGELSRALPEAIRLRTARDQSLTEALTPTIVTALHKSIKKDPDLVAEAISPLMGPAIRRAISNALKGWIQSFDQTLKYSFSWTGLKWRLEAVRAGRSFAEVVLYHTLIYRVEQVFLIHKQTGSRLLHAATGSVSTKDPDLVSGLLTAIQDAIRNFARDSFNAAQDEPIKKLHRGEREVWFEAGPQAILAVVIRGCAPQNLRSRLLAPTIEAIHFEMRESLESFDGDAAPFELVRHHLENCLHSRFQIQSDRAGFRIPIYVKLVLVMIVAALVVWGFSIWREQRHWNEYVEALRATPGIVVTETGTSNGKHYVAGLRDPLSVHPDEILKQKTRLDRNSVISRWERYQALDPQFVIQRTKKLLNPPQSVELRIDSGVLVASGSAPHEWVYNCRKFALAVPGVESFDDQNLLDEGMIEPRIMRNQIESRIIRFATGTTRLIPGQSRELKELASEMQKLIALAPTVNITPQFLIVGHTASEGGDSVNVNLSQQRAVRVVSLLAARGVNIDLMTAIGAGTTEPLSSEANEYGNRLNRSASFKVFLLDPERTRGGGTHR